MSAEPLPSVALVVLDGWGLAPTGPGNAVSLADTPVFDELWGSYPHTQLEASGEAVGLPAGQMGNSEVGHLNLGAGSVVKQDLVRIDDAIEDGELLRERGAAGGLRGRSRRRGGGFHLIGLVSAGGVHSSLGHLRACIELAVREQVPELVLHAFTDGRDTLPTSSPGLSRAGRVAGSPRRRRRRHARPDRHGDRPLLGDGPRQPLGPHEARLRRDRARRGPDAPRRAQDGVRAGLRARRDRRVHPADGRSASRGRCGTADSVITFNFRPDRMRQIVRALGEEDFDEFDRRGVPPCTSRR